MSACASTRNAVSRRVHLCSVLLHVSRTLVRAAAEVLARVRGGGHPPCPHVCARVLVLSRCHRHVRACDGVCGHSLHLTKKLTCGSVRDCAWAEHHQHEIIQAPNTRLLRRRTDGLDQNDAHRCQIAPHAGDQDTADMLI